MRIRKFNLISATAVGQIYKNHALAHSYLYQQGNR